MRMILPECAAPVRMPLSTMPDLLLSTLNARHAHASLGLRCLRANLGPLRDRSEILEFVIGARTEDLAEKILAREPRVLGLGVYIWNVEESTRLVALLRRIAPALKIVLGGPEVSHETGEQAICRMADHVITGPGELAFARLAQQLLDGPTPLMKQIAGDEGDPTALALPYDEYSAEDLSTRHLYLEASRGCPYRCEFCLSALDRSARPFDLAAMLQAMARLHARGARRFRFVDRTFNLKASTGAAILDFFLERIQAAPQDPLFLHFELVPDHLPPSLRERIARFPAGSLQFEIGIQSWNPQVQALISRRQDNSKAEANLAWLRTQTQAHLHVDLIAGLPGESLESFGEGFDRLVALRPHEIQVGVLKRLRGAPIRRHEEAFAMRFNPAPPYNLLANRDIAFVDMQRIGRFARYWDLIGNSGRFIRTLPMLLGDAPFARFLALSDWIYARTDATHRISAERLYELVHRWLAQPAPGVDPQLTPSTAVGIEAALAADYAESGARGRPGFLARGLPGSSSVARDKALLAPTATLMRQHRHLR